MEKVLPRELTISVRYFPLCVFIYKMEVILPPAYLDSFKRKKMIQYKIAFKNSFE